MNRIVRWLDRCIRPAASLSFLSCFVFAVWLIGFAPDQITAKYLMPASIFLSALMATCGWMWSGHLNRRLNRKTQATNLLLAIRQPYVNQLKATVYGFIEERHKIAEAVETNPGNVLPQPKRPTAEIEQLLGIYELLAICVMNGTADEDMIKESQKFVFMRLYDGLKDYIDKRQANETSLYIHMVHYTKTWNEGSSRFKPTYVTKDRDFL